MEQTTCTCCIMFFDVDKFIKNERNLSLIVAHCTLINVYRLCIMVYWHVYICSCAIYWNHYKTTITCKQFLEFHAKNTHEPAEKGW